MRIAIRQQGGIFGIDRCVIVTDDAATITEQGVTRPARSPDANWRARAEQLAARVAAEADKVVAWTGSLPSDVMTTEIEIERAGHRQRLALSSGDSAPDAVWELVGLLDDLAATP